MRSTREKLHDYDNASEEYGKDVPKEQITKQDMDYVKNLMREGVNKKYKEFTPKALVEKMETLEPAPS